MTSRLNHQAVIALLVVAGSTAALAQEGAQVLFASGGINVIDANGVQRVANQGDTLRAGDRLVTPPGVMAQIKLPDGTMVGARPDSEVRLQQFGAGTDKTVLQLNQGNVRVINVDTPTGVPGKPVDVVTPVSTLQLGRGDGQTVHTRGGSPDQTGTFSRMQVGTGVVSTPSGNLALDQQQTARVAGVGSAPLAIADLPRAMTQLAAVASTERGRGDRPAASGSSPINSTTSQLLTPQGNVNATERAVATLAAANPGMSIRSPVSSLPTADVPRSGGSSGLGSVGGGGRLGSTPTIAGGGIGSSVRVAAAPPPPPPPPPPKTRVQLLRGR